MPSLPIHFARGRSGPGEWDIACNSLDVIVVAFEWKNVSCPTCRALRPSGTGESGDEKPRQNHNI